VFLARSWERLVPTLLFLCAAITLITTVTVIGILGKETFAFFQLVSISDFFLGLKWEPLIEPKSFGVWPLVAGTFLVVAGAALIAIPLGVLIAVYLSEYAHKRFRDFLKPVLEILAGIPTVVYGYFALTFVTPMLRVFWPDTQIFNAASASIVVGIMILPMMASLTDDALQGIPRVLREGGFALGAHSYEVILFVVIPAALSRIVAALILAVSRAVGETMAVALAAGSTPKLTMNPLESVQTMTGYIVQVAMGDTPAGGVEYLTSFTVAALLFVITFLFNFIGSSIMSARAKVL
jgi:phosphate transport system permease protein